MTAVADTLRKNRGKRILIDTNLLLLYLIGTFERARITRFKRTSDFTEDDFELLATFLSAFPVIVTTPHLLTEVGNLANSLPAQLKPAWAMHFAFQTARLIEVFQPAVEIMLNRSFSLFGLADAAIHAASGEILVLTEDYPLSGFLQSQGIDVLSFRDLAFLAAATK